MAFEVEWHVRSLKITYGKLEGIVQTTTCFGKLIHTTTLDTSRNLTTVNPYCRTMDMMRLIELNIIPKHLKPIYV